MKKYALLSLLFLIVIFSCIHFAGTFLVFDEPPKKSDVVVVLSGDRGERTIQGAQLFRQGFAPSILFSGGIVYNNITMAELMKKHAEELGVPENSILVEDKADSTYENAIFTRDLMKLKGLKSAIVVSSNYHMKRVKFLFDREFKDTGITLTYSAAQDREFNPSRWWASNKSIMITFNEYIKFLGYAFGKNV